jgi:hypothetical protein
MIAQPGTDPLAILDPRLRERASDLTARFRSAEPFPHLVLDGFLRDDACRRLLEEFPAFERGNFLDENGRPGYKSVYESVRDLGPAFAALDALVSAPEFLALVGEITGVERLLYDPDYLGGGTHDNRAGQRLDFHVDFNRHPRGWDRRLNLLLYLNPEWDVSWGGCLELRRDPRMPAPPIAPVLNRAVLFETSESSWHGFPTIRPDVTQPRRSVALYFYSKELRKTASHSTIYVEEPASPSALERVPELLLRRMENLARLERRERGLLEQLRDELRQSLASGGTRDPDVALWPIEFVDREIARLLAAEVDLRAALERTAILPRVPMRGPLRPISQSGFWHDGWVARKLAISCETLAPVEELLLRGQIPSEIPRQELKVGDSVRSFPPGPFEWRMPFRASPGEPIPVEIHAVEAFCPRRLGLSDDSRELAWQLHAIETDAR